MPDIGIDPGHGSEVVGATADIAQCVPALPGTAYNFGGWVRRPSGGGAGYTGLSVDWRRGANCSMPTGQGPFIPAKGTLDAWELLLKTGSSVRPGSRRPSSLARRRGPKVPAFPTRPISMRSTLRLHPGTFDSRLAARRRWAPRIGTGTCARVEAAHLQHPYVIAHAGVGRLTIHCVPKRSTHMPK